MADAPKVIVTGASGVLGAAICDAFRAAGWDTIGLTRSRVTPGLTQLDLLDEDSVEALFQQLRPHWVIHCAGYSAFSTKNLTEGFIEVIRAKEDEGFASKQEWVDDMLNTVTDYVAAVKVRIHLIIKRSIFTTLRPTN